MKLLIALVGAVIALTGCVAVPVGGYADPGYGPGYYGAPAFSFGYSHYGHGGHGGHGGHRRHR